jgi:stage V sporulation protein AF
MLILVKLVGGWGILLGTLLMLLFVVTNKSIDGSRSYLYPLIPFNGKALLGLIVRTKKSDVSK